MFFPYGGRRHLSPQAGAAALKVDEMTFRYPGHAAVIGLSPDKVRYGLLILLAFAIVTGIQTVGVVLISALLVTPAATASTACP